MPIHRKAKRKSKKIRITELPKNKSKKYLDSLKRVYHRYKVPVGSAIAGATLASGAYYLHSKKHRPRRINSVVGTQTDYVPSDESNLPPPPVYSTPAASPSSPSSPSFVYNTRSRRRALELSSAPASPTISEITPVSASPSSGKKKKTVKPKSSQQPSIEELISQSRNNLKKVETEKSSTPEPEQSIYTDARNRLRHVETTNNQQFGKRRRILSFSFTLKKLKKDLKTIKKCC